MNTIRNIQHLSALRAARWHAGEDRPWSLLEWTGAMCGEAGEAANVAKKIKRVESTLKNIDTRGQNTTSGYKLALCRELADTILYAVCSASAAGLDLEDILVDVFNKKSEEYGFPEFLEKMNP